MSHCAHPFVRDRCARCPLARRDAQQDPYGEMQSAEATGGVTSAGDSFSHKRSPRRSTTPITRNIGKRKDYEVRFALPRGFRQGDDRGDSRGFTKKATAVGQGGGRIAGRSGSGGMGATYHALGREPCDPDIGAEPGAEGTKDAENGDVIEAAGRPKSFSTQRLCRCSLSCLGIQSNTVSVQLPVETWVRCGVV